MSKRTRTWLKRCTLALILGVIATVGIAWAMAWQFAGYPRLTGWSFDDGKVCIVREGRGMREIEWSACDQLTVESATLLAECHIYFECTPRGLGNWDMPEAQGMRLTSPLTPRTTLHSSPTIKTMSRRIETEHGWPFQTLWHWQDAEYGRVHGAIPFETLGRLRERYPGQAWSGLSYLPIWSGIILNTLFYAMLFVCLISIPDVTRSIRHRVHDGCPHCGYDLAGLTSSQCPECGATIK